MLCRYCPSNTKVKGKTLFSVFCKMEITFGLVREIMLDTGRRGVKVGL